MTQEEVERRQTHESYRTGDRLQTSSVENLGPTTTAHSGVHGYGHQQEATETFPAFNPAVEKTMRKAFKQADKTTPPEKGRRKSEEEKPERILRTVEEPKTAALLPVVSEAGENGEPSEKRVLSSADESDRSGVESPDRFGFESPPSVVTTNFSIPGLRKVSPSTVGTATEMQDDTSVSSPHVMDGEKLSHVDSAHGVDEEKVSPEVNDSYSEGLLEQHEQHEHDYNYFSEKPPTRIREKPPRLASDLIQPHSPLAETLMKSLNELSPEREAVVRSS